MRVFSRIPAESSAARIWPTVQSNDDMASPRKPMGDLPRKRLWGHRGTWTSLVHSHMKNGWLRWAKMNLRECSAMESAMFSSRHRARPPPRL